MEIRLVVHLNTVELLKYVEMLSWETYHFHPLQGASSTGFFEATPKDFMKINEIMMPNLEQWYH